MIRLQQVSGDWQSEAFPRNLKQAIEGLPSASLPLHLCVTEGGIVDDSNISVTVLHLQERESGLRGRIGVFFTEIVGGCSCGDDPLEKNVYCELNMTIDRGTGEAEFSPDKI